MRRVILALVVIAVLGLSIAAIAEPMVIKAAMQTSAPTLDPHMSTNTVVQQIAVHVFEPLVAYGEDYSEIVPVLAESWEMDSSGLRYTFHLQPKAKFSDGDPLTAEDVAASLHRLAEYSPISEEFEMIEEIIVVDSLTITVVLDKKVDLVRLMAGPVTWQGIMKKDIAEAAGPEEIRIPNLIGTGPYKLVEWLPDIHVKLAKNTYYTPYTEAPRSGFGGKKDPIADEIYFIPVPEVSTRLAGLQAGEYDFAEALPVTSYRRLVADPGITPQVVKPAWALIWELNHQWAPMDNVVFRQALLAALDMDAVLKTVAMGDESFYRTQPSFWGPEQTLLHNMAGQEKYNQQNLPLAKRLLEEAGYDGEEIIILSNRDYDWMYRCTLAAAAQLEQAGIKVRIEFSDWNSQIGKALTLKNFHIRFCARQSVIAVQRAVFLRLLQSRNGSSAKGSSASTKRYRAS
jgi:peptide/nickel transport system substrate-binding protein